MWEIKEGEMSPMLCIGDICEEITSVLSWSEAAAQGGCLPATTEAKEQGQERGPPRIEEEKETVRRSGWGFHFSTLSLGPLLFVASSLSSSSS